MTSTPLRLGETHRDSVQGPPAPNRNLPQGMMFVYTHIWYIRQAHLWYPCLRTHLNEGFLAAGVWYQCIALCAISVSSGSVSGWFSAAPETPCRIDVSTALMSEKKSLERVLEDSAIEVRICMHAWYNIYICVSDQDELREEALRLGSDDWMYPKTPYSAN